MRELSKEEMAGIAGGYARRRPLAPSNRIQICFSANPLTVTFGTPVAPGFVLPDTSSVWFFGN